MKELLRKVRAHRRVRYLYDSSHFLRFVTTDGKSYAATQAGYEQAYRHELELIDAEKEAHHG